MDTLDYLVHVLSGKKAWHTSDGTYLARTGDTLFFRKGAAVIEQFFEVDFCLLLFFIPDELVKSTVREIAALLPSDQMPGAPLKSAVRVENDVALNAFFQSMTDVLFRPGKAIRTTAAGETERTGRQRPDQPEQPEAGGVVVSQMHQCRSYQVSFVVIKNIWFDPADPTPTVWSRLH